ncbi:D-arabinono-1,4-lactone oxidase [Microbacterium sp. YY-03]|uniref:D-arabinono-1,4-lactone oxidase n=1 Tax=Microbacterium sp. YY-03 TaxID=3421636 RepID=UPI003D182E75
MTRPGGKWQNWARSASIRPQRVEFPRSAEAVQRAVLAAKDRGMLVKAVGSGHSFTGIAVAPGVLLDLSDLSGIVTVDTERRLVTLKAGTKLHQIPQLLAPYGLAMENLGDIDRQSISGAISTGTHGTGSTFGGISTQIVGATLVTAAGEFRTIDENNSPELIPAIALGLGALGVLIDVTVQCVPAFLMHAVERREPIQDVVANIHERATGVDHFEFYWFPHTEFALTKENTRLPEGDKRHPLPRASKWVDETLLANGVYRLTCALGHVAPAIIPPVSRMAAQLTGSREYTDLSTNVFTQSRTVRFREMEYAIPVENVQAAFDELRSVINRNGWKISFPVEVRFAKGDDRWLSTAHGRDSAYIAVHRYWKEDPSQYFRAVEAIMSQYGGRPHWGKMHTLRAETLRERYPRFDDFVALRNELDPERMFRNAYLDRVLGA